MKGTPGDLEPMKTAAAAVSLVSMHIIYDNPFYISRAQICKQQGPNNRTAVDS